MSYIKKPLTTSNLVVVNNGRLSPTEAMVLELVLQFKVNKQIADELGISIKTVEKHRQACSDKLGSCDPLTMLHAAVKAGIADIKKWQHLKVEYHPRLTAAQRKSYTPGGRLRMGDKRRVEL